MLGRAECAAYLANSGYGQPKRTMLLVLSLQGRGPWDSVVIWSELRPLTGNSDICILLTDGESTPALAIAVSVDAYHGLSPYMALSRPCAKARSGGMSILPPMMGDLEAPHGRDGAGRVLGLDLVIDERIEQELFSHVLEEVLLSPALEHAVGDLDVAQVPSARDHLRLMAVVAQARDLP